MSRQGKKYIKLPINKRKEILRERLETGKSFNYLGRKHNISPNTIKTWMKIYRRDGGLDTCKKGRPLKEKNIDYKERYEILKKFQEFLEEVDQEKK